jgi:hypothetical protein
MRYWGLLAAAGALLVASTVRTAPQTSDEQVEEVWTPQIPAALAGPYIVDPQILADYDAPGDDCSAPGHQLTFTCLIYRDGRTGVQSTDAGSNPFKHAAVFDEVSTVITKDLEWIRTQPQFGGSKAVALKPGFLEYDGARIELVGVVNRMDRQFNRDPVPEHGRELACGEISAIYRFGYSGELASGMTKERRYGSRLPVTMNVVFSAQPWKGGPTCKEVAARWLSYAQSMKDGAPIAILRAKAKDVVSSLRAADIDRIELNMQGSRVPGSKDDASVKQETDSAQAQPDGTDFGTLATYIIRVFRWDKVDRTAGHWHTKRCSSLPAW